MSSNQALSTSSHFAIAIKLADNSIRQLKKDQVLPTSPHRLIAISRQSHLNKLKNLSNKARKSWNTQFSYKEEQVFEDGSIREGLRPPQIGALHAALAHWKVTNTSATV